MADTAVLPVEEKDKLSNRNLIMFSLGTFGRDFLYNFFTGQLLTFVMFTKHLSALQFSMISLIIIAARIFDALNDPFMGGVVENTRTKWGKYKPWQLIGCVLTAGVIVALFSIEVDEWGFIGLLAAMYFLFSITFTMNDISYWGMMPSLTSNPHDRNKLTSFAQIVASAGGGLCGLIVPAFTVGAFSSVFGGAVGGFRVMAIFSGILMTAFQLFTILGVKEKPLPADLAHVKPMTVKEMFRTIAKNDQLMWCALVMMLYCTGTSVVGNGLGLMYVYFEFGYNGVLWTVFYVGFSVTSTAFTLFYPWLSKKFGRDKLIYSTGLSIIIGYAIMLVIALAVPNVVLFDVLGMTVTLKYLLLTLAFAIPGWGAGFYMIMVINLANTVEYNEYKTGRRDESLIFSLRPFTSKLSSALTQGLVMVVYLIVGVVQYTNSISNVEKGLYADGSMIPSGVEIDKVAEITSAIANVPESAKMWLIACGCLIPMAFMAVALVIYKKKCILNESTLEGMMNEIEERRKASAENIPEVETITFENEKTTTETERITIEKENLENVDL